MPADTTPARSELAAHRSWLARGGILVLAWATLLGLVVGLGQLLTGPLKGSVSSTDKELARWFVSERTSSLNQVAESFSLLGDTTTVLVVVPTIALVVAAWRRSIRPALFVVLATTGVSGMYILSADAVLRPRPAVKILDQGLDPLHSFPSGHVGAATALVGVVVVLVWTYAQAVRWWVTPLLLPLPLLVVVSRMYEGAHHLSDVLTSVVFASTWVTVTAVTLLPRASVRAAPASRAGAPSHASAG
ncbi:MAG: phosphatase PAP2 family protein [Actinomycetota bacterium]|nr:phosphatase PAP2 family protein [Actinomycetota bacterium]